ncbi:hypothetical protein HanXRQr2_Chr04g0152441 [Helianthus annuus]|uniref:Uncharacterized protein n=1 Tax=Helianthus annuus TaxID=4232 RepID=A0A9K3J6Y6_HELAN|nr:hypothetical protein HanXRQr2_Chr04g0152441 [Helianthus annuus]
MLYTYIFGSLICQIFKSSNRDEIYYHISLQHWYWYLLLMISALVLFGFGERTFGVLTKIDLMDKGTDGVDAIDRGENLANLNDKAETLRDSVYLFLIEPGKQSRVIT